MARDAAVRIDGLARFRRDLARLAGDAGDLKAANAAASRIVAAAGAGRAPRRTGRTAATVRPATTMRGVLVRAGGARAPGAGPIHWGWPARGIVGRPFLVEGAQATEPVWLAAYLADLDRAVAKISGTY